MGRTPLQGRLVSQVHGPEASKAALVIWQLDPPMRRQGWEERCWYTIRQGEHVWDRGDSLESLGALLFNDDNEKWTTRRRQAALQGCRSGQPSR